MNTFVNIDSLNRARIRRANTSQATHIQRCGVNQALFMASVYKKGAAALDKRGCRDQARRWREYARGYLARACEEACEGADHEN